MLELGSRRGGPTVASVNCRCHFIVSNSADLSQRVALVTRCRLLKVTVHSGHTRIAFWPCSPCRLVSVKCFCPGSGSASPGRHTPCLLKAVKTSVPLVQRTLRLSTAFHVMLAGKPLLNQLQTRGRRCTPTHHSSTLRYAAVRTPTSPCMIVSKDCKAPTTGFTFQRREQKDQAGWKT